MRIFALTLGVTAAFCVTAQSLPIDFETPVSGMIGYDNATFTRVANPSGEGNSSANVGKIVKITADQWAGGKIVGMSSLNFNTTASSVLSMDVFTTQPPGTVIKIKLEGPYTSEVDAVTSVSGTWETLLFDFGIPAPNGSTHLVIMPQPFTPGGGATFYVDNIKQVADPVAPMLGGLPLTFESDATTDHFFDFESAFATVVTNPHQNVDNPSATVAKLVRYRGAPFGGTKITFSNNLSFATHTVLSMKVWTSAPVGTYVTLKTEKPFWGVERSVQTTKSGDWETLTFDFAGVPSDMPSLVFLFDFVAGSTNVGNGSANSTFFFDEVKYSGVPLSIDEDAAPTGVRAYPNPTLDYWTFEAAPQQSVQVRLYTLTGQLVDEARGIGQVVLRADGRAPGVYLATVQLRDYSEVLRVHVW
ncbi:MAG: T9SS type A sorting domain-containing protein [Bacteroidota bacterium]